MIPQKAVYIKAINLTARAAFLLFFINLIFTSNIHACSGPHAMEAINASIHDSVKLAIPAGLSVILTWLISRAFKSMAAILLSVLMTILFVIHPVWTISAMVGDCGQAKLAYSKIFTGIILGLFTLQVVLFSLKRLKRD